MNKISPVILSKPSQIGQVQDPLLKTKGSVSEKSFSDHLETAVQDVDIAHRVADTKLEQLASGEDVDIHGTMIALQEADISIRTISAFRDKFTDAYKNLINMAI